MDDRISQLQSMFPSIEGDVIGVVLNESDNNVEEALEKLLWLSSGGNGAPISSSVTASPTTTNSVNPNGYQDVGPRSQPRQPSTYGASQVALSNWSWLSPGFSDTREPSAHSKEAKVPQGNAKHATNSPQFRTRGNRTVKTMSGQQHRDGDYATTGTLNSSQGQSGHGGSAVPSGQYSSNYQQLAPYFPGLDSYGSPQLQPQYGSWVDPTGYQVPYQQLYQPAQAGNGATSQLTSSAVNYGAGAKSASSSGISGTNSAAESGNEDYLILGSQPSQSSGVRHPVGELEEWPLHSNPQSENILAESDVDTKDKQKTFIGSSSERRQSNEGVSSMAAHLGIDDSMLTRTAKMMVILRGLPGSGKSTLARQLVGATGIVCCTDDFFVVDGQYVFDPSLLEANHEKNRLKARRALQSGVSPVIIDNTNTAAWEMKPYVTLAHEFGYKVVLREPSTLWKFRVAELTRRNGHGVPRQAIERMLERYEHHLSINSILASRPPERNREHQPPRERHSSHFPRRENRNHHPHSSHPPPSRNHSSSSPSGVRRQWQDRYRDTNATVGHTASINPGGDHTHPSRLPRKPASSHDSPPVMSRHLGSSPGPSPNPSPNPSPRSRKKAPPTSGYQGHWQSQEGAADYTRPFPEQPPSMPLELTLSSTSDTAPGLTVGTKNLGSVDQTSNSKFGADLPSVAMIMQTRESEDFHKEPTASKGSEVKVSATSIDNAYTHSDLQQWESVPTSAQLQPQQEWAAKQQSGSLGNSTSTASHGGGRLLYNSIWSPSPPPGDSSPLVLGGWESNQELRPQTNESSGKALTSQVEWTSSKPRSVSPVARLQPPNQYSSEPYSQAQKMTSRAGEFFHDFQQMGRSMDNEAEWSPPAKALSAAGSKGENPLPSRDPIQPAPSSQLQTPRTVFLPEKRSDSSFEDPAILEKGYKYKTLEQIPAHASLQGEAVLGKSTGLALSVPPHSLIPPVDAAMNVSSLPPSSEHANDFLAHELDPFATPFSVHQTGTHYRREPLGDLFSSPRAEMVCGEAENDREAKTGSKPSPYQIDPELDLVYVPPGLTSNANLQSTMSESPLTVGTEAVSDTYFPSAFTNSQLGEETLSAEDSFHLIAPLEATPVHARADTLTDESHGYDYGDITEPDTPIACASTNSLSYPHEDISTPTIGGAGIDSELQMNLEVSSSSELVGLCPLQAATPTASHGGPNSVRPWSLGYPDPRLSVSETEEEAISNVSNVSNASSGEEPIENSFLVDVASVPPALWGTPTSTTWASSSLHYPGPSHSNTGADREEYSGEYRSCTASTSDDQDTNKVEEDLAFLTDCFPDLEQSYLRRLYDRCMGNVEEAVSHALLSSVNPLSPRGDISGFHFNSIVHSQHVSDTETSSNVSSVSNGSDLANLASEDDILDDEEEESSEEPRDGANLESAVEMIELLQLDDPEPNALDSLLNEQGPPTTECFSTEGLEDLDECIDDEEIARLLQEQLNLEASEERITGVDTTLLAESHGGPKEYQPDNKPKATDDVSLPFGNLPLTEVETSQAALPDPTPGGERVPREEKEQGGPQADRTEDNLILKLTPSLARQLQDMFGAVMGRLLPEGKLVEDDLEVLLSERAAAEIYQKWKDTLEAKKIEHTVQSELRMKKDAALARELQEAENRQLHPLFHTDRPGSDGAAEKSKELWEAEKRRKKRRHNTTIPPLISTGGTRGTGTGDQSEQSTCLEPPVQKTQEATNTSARPLGEIIDEQLAAYIDDQEVSNAVRAVCNVNAARQRNLQHLYNSFPKLDRAYIDRVLVGTRFKFKNTADKLMKHCREQEATANTTSTDGNMPSNHTNKSSHGKRGTSKTTYSKKASVGIKANPGSKAAKSIHGRRWDPRSATRVPAHSRMGGAKASSTTSPAKPRKQKTRAEPRKPQHNRKAAHEGNPYQPWATDQAQLSYDDLRVEAALHANLRAEAFNKAAHARSRKQGEIATYYAQQGHMHTQKMREANERAAEAILKLRNDLSSDSLDLHGLHVSEALEALQNKLSTIRKGTVINVITGKGIHSKGKEARIKPAVVQYLQDKGYSYGEPNAGMLKVKA